MSAVLTAKGLTAGHGTHVLFSDLDLTVAPREVTGLVGVNGAGKSTLLRLLAGLDGSALAHGSVTLHPPSATVGPRARGAPTTRTRPRSTGASTWAGRTWRSGPRRSSPPSACGWSLTGR